MIEVQRQVCTAVNVAMMTACRNIGKAIYESCGENDQAAYGEQVLKYIPEQLAAEFGRGFNIRNPRYMRQFYLTFPNVNTLRSELSRTHYCCLMKVNDAKARVFYLEARIKAEGYTGG